MPRTETRLYRRADTVFNKPARTFSLLHFALIVLVATAAVDAVHLPQRHPLPRTPATSGRIIAWVNGYGGRLAVDSIAVFLVIASMLHVDRYQRRAREHASELQDVQARLEEQNITLEFQNAELARREAALERAKEGAEEAARSKGEFLANMSHEIRTPMTAVLGYADLLLQDPSVAESPEERRAALEAIHRNGRHLLTIINDILDFSKIDAGKMTVERISMSPRDVVHDVVTMMEERASAKGLRLAARFEKRLPSRVVCDPARLRQILINLVGNAIKFTEQGGVQVAVRFEAVQDEQGTLAIDVSDTGIGLAEDKISLLFDAFAQADASTTRRFGGTGLGLAISQRLAELLGGKITVTSELGCGSTFTVHVAVSLPADSVDDEPGACQDSQPHPATPTSQPAGTISTTLHHRDRTALSSPLAGQRVLLAEDGIDNQRLISLILKKAGADVDVVENGREAVGAVATAASAQPYDVILMDMQMPVMDGLAATRELRQLGCTVPIIALTANAMAGARDACLAAGCDDYISKPIQRSAFIAKLAERASRVC